MATWKILAIDDDPSVLEDVLEALVGAGFEVRTAQCGKEGLRIASAFGPDLVILDIMLDGRADPSCADSGEAIDGFAVLRKLRDGDDVPVLMLSRTSAEPVKVAALQLGADDYVTKPFGRAELAARVEAILRRGGPSSTRSETITTHHFEIRQGSREVYRDGELLSLTRVEFDLLLALITNEGQVLSRDRLLGMVWGHGHAKDERLVDAHIRRVRKKVEPEPSQPRFIKTAHGAGYRFVDESS